jgi:hypothetical protein
MKKTGMASAATVIALNGFKVEVLANQSGTPPTCGTKNVQVYFAWNHVTTTTGSGSGATPAEAIAKATAMAKFMNDGGTAKNDVAPGPGDFSTVSKCATSIITSSGSFPGTGQPPSTTGLGDSGVVGSPTRYTADVKVYSGTTMWYRKTYTSAPGHPNSSTCAP